jgi:hypothetical protein
LIASNGTLYQIRRLLLPLSKPERWIGGSSRHLTLRRSYARTQISKFRSLTPRVTVVCCVSIICNLRSITRQFGTQFSAGSFNRTTCWAWLATTSVMARRCRVLSTGLAYGVEGRVGGISDKPDLGRVKAAVQAAGYKNERVVMLATADFPVINIMCQIAADMLQKIGMNVDYQAQDWATVSTRMNSKEPLASGGWSVTCNFTSGIGLYNPAAHTWLRSNGAKAFAGWPNIPEIEKLRLDWLEASDLPAQQAICQNIQKVAFDPVPYVPLGFYYQPTAFRSNLTGILKGVPMFYNVRRI